MDKHPNDGLAGVIVADSRLSEVDGEAGRLTIAGYPLERLAAQAEHEEVIHLLWRGRLPTAGELEDLRGALRPRRALPAITRALVEASADAAPMDMLGAAVASLATDADAPATRLREPAPAELDPVALRLVAALPTIIAAHWRAHEGAPPVAPDPALARAANFLYMLEGSVPDPARARALETYLNAVVDHGMNASTFTARVIASTRSDLVSAITGAIGALKGPLHGGAPGPVLDMILDIEDLTRAEDNLRARVQAGERLMGFGHRVYRVRDPRAAVLADAARALAASGAREDLFQRARVIEDAALTVLREHKPGRALHTNVEFYTALLLHAVGLPRELFTATFAIGRVIGWLAHCAEQRDTGRLLRPRARYVGPRDCSWRPLAAR